MNARKVGGAFVLAAAFLMTAPAAFAQNVPASGNTSGSGNFSVTLGATPVLVLPDPTTPYPSSNGGIVHTRHHELLINNSLFNYVGCSRFNSTPSASDPQTFILSPSQYGNNRESFDPPKFAPQYPLWCVVLPYNGTVNSVPLYVEAW